MSFENWTIEELFARCTDYDDGSLSMDKEEFAALRRMLQGAEPVTTAYKLPANTPCKEAPEHIWLQTAGVWPENGEFSELTWCSDNQHDDDTLYVRADVVSGNSPVIPDGWVACSERMPKKGDYDIWVFSPSRGVNDGVAWDGEEFIDDECRFRIHDATHWMEKIYPAAPQQEVK